MVDRVSEAVRKYNMRQIGQRDTKPELLVRRFLHAQGFRYRLHRSDLPGRPDVVLPKYRTVVQVYGCFWHQHPASHCVDSHVPDSNTAYWRAKLEANVSRDRRNEGRLRQLGWHVEVVWACEADEGSLQELAARIKSRLRHEV